MKAFLWQHRVLWLPTVQYVLGMVACVLVLIPILVALVLLLEAIGVISVPYLGMW